MNAQFRFKLLQHLNKKKSAKGFTLIELLVVVIIVGILAAIALPNLLGQIGKARETEAKNAVGATNRGQQSYNIERRGRFADGVDITNTSNPLGVVSTSDYYTYGTTSASNDTTPPFDTATATINPVAVNPTTDGVRDYEGGIAFSAGSFESGVCQSDAIGDTITALPVAGGGTNVPTFACSTGGEEIE